MKLTKLFIFLLLFKILAQAGIGSATYQKLGMDARGIAMGRAASSISYGASAILWNPANLCRHSATDGRKFDAMMSYMKYPNYDIEYITSAVAFRGDRFGLGVGFIQYGVDDIPEYNIDMDYLGSFNDLERSAFIGISFKLPYVMNFGISLQYLTQGFSGSYSTEVDQAFGLRAGILFIPFQRYQQLVISMSFNNRSLGGYDETRLVTTAGLMWNTTERKSHYMKRLIITSEIEQEEKFPLKLKFGAELFAVEIENFRLHLRMGLDDIDIETRSEDLYKDACDVELSDLILLNMKKTVGFGITFPSFELFDTKISFRFDYAFVDEAYRNLQFITLGLSL